MEPLLRYAGSKRRIADLIVSQMTDVLNYDRGRYLELFAGGAAVFWRLAPTVELHEGPAVRGVLADVCKPIISFYDALQREPVALYNQLEKISLLPHNPDTYYGIRSEFNYHDYGPNFAARLLYLNKTGFNGLFRLNKDLEYNVPWGKKLKPPKFPSLPVLCLASSALRKVSLYACDYKQILSKSHEHDVIYVDPPYWNTYDGYSGDGFTNKNHEELADQLRCAVDRGSHIFASNIDCPEIRKLYDWATIHTVPLKHNIGRTASSRRVVNEVLIVSKAPYKDPRQLDLV